MRILTSEMLVATTGAGFALLLQGCGGAYGPDDPTPEPQTTEPPTTSGTTAAPDLGDFCCWYPKHEEGKDDRTAICKNCKTAQYQTSAKYCDPNGGVWCGEMPATTSAKPTTTGPSSARTTTTSGNATTLTTTSAHTTSGGTTTSTGPHPTTSPGPTNPPPPGPEPPAGGVVYHRNASVPAGYFCTGDYGYDRKVIDFWGATKSVQRCAEVVNSDRECSRVFYFGTDASAGKSLCRCVMNARECQVAKGSGDGFENSVYVIEPPSVAMAPDPRFQAGQFCKGDYGRVRKALAGDAERSPDECAKAAADDFECGESFYFGAGAGGKGNLCRCVLGGQPCAPAPNNPEDGHWNIIYKFLGTSARAAYRRAPGFAVGEFCAGEWDKMRKRVTTLGTTVDACAAAVAQDGECGALFYFGQSSDPAQPTLCRCVMGHENCQKAPPNPSDSYTNTLYELTAAAAQAKLDQIDPDSGSLVGSYILHRSGSFASPDDTVSGFWYVAEFQDLKMQFQKGGDGQIELWSHDNAATFWTPDHERFVAVDLPAWLQWFFFNQTNPVAALI